jgi:plastocyanin
MKKILITLTLTFQITFSFSQDYTIDVTAKSKNDYKISGKDLNGNNEGLDIDLNFAVGNKIIFNINSPGHPFLIKLKPGTGKKNLVEDANNNGIAKGTIEWVPTQPGTYYYQCLKHKGMVGKIIIS